MSHKPPSIDSYEKASTAAAKALSKLAEISSNKILSEIEREEDSKEYEKKMKYCDMIHQIVNEGLDMYKDGDLSLKETITEIKEALDLIK